ncbi:unnamed protein product [Callosobruchus maculatus]|uniref:MRH domain-containing protein n=1 Tax=Callosobruchus maculatus TaxID=64391 RepID=A0A653D7M9_CALMS|nr:unnamed protein product [Callosobruchus maculatus]
MSECLQIQRSTKLSNFFILLIIFLTNLTSVYTSPLVLDDASSCSKTKLGNSFFFTNKMWSATKENVTVYFNLCDKLPGEICGDNIDACVKHKNGTVILKGNLDFRVVSLLGSSEKDKRFSLAIENSIGKVAVGSTTLDIQIIDICSIMKGVEMKIEERILGSTTYHVDMNDPTCPCTIKIKDKHLDLRPIKGTYSVQSSSNNFSISLCEPNKLCEGVDVTACIIKSGKTGPLSEMSSEMLEYQKSENQVVLKGKYKKGGIKTDFELRLICNWIMTTPKIVYSVPSSQGKNYHFLMESSQACIVENPQCEFSTGNPTYYYYNLSSLNNDAGYMVTNVSDGSSMYINPCGRLKFRGEKNFCTDTYSQICEVKGNKYLNKGSMLKNYQARAADLSLTYSSGIRCKDNDTKQYETHISFVCSKKDDHPKVMKSDECNLYIKWNTPAACLKARKKDCDEIPEPRRHSCVIEQDGQIYDLSKLAKENSSYVLKDNDDPSIEYLLNVCASVVDFEAVCIKGASVILKDAKEIDIKKRVKLLGKLNSLTKVNEKLVIDATNGHPCDHGEYSSKIVFICSEKEEAPILAKKTNCNFEFLFKTKYACGNQTVPGEGAACSFKHPSTSQMFDFKNPEENVIAVPLKNTLYYFNICRTEPQAKCSNGECLYVQPKKLLFVHEGKKYLDFQLNRTCKSSDEFNRTLIELLCEPGVESNDRSTILNIANCILYLTPVISQACSTNKNTEDQTDSPDIEKTKYSIGNIDSHDKPLKYEDQQLGTLEDKKNSTKNAESVKKGDFDVEVKTKVSSEKTDERKKKEEVDVEVNTKLPKQDAVIPEKKLNCTSFIKNNDTGYIFDISSLKTPVEIIGCPSIAFNYSNNSVSITYPTKNICMKVRSTDSKYNVVMKCVPGSDYKIVRDDCNQIIVNNLDACKLLERIPTSGSYSKGAVAGITITVILILGIVVTVAVLAYVRIYRKRISYGSVSYEKDTDL